MEDCQLFAPSGLIQSCARSSVTFYALGLQQSWGNDRLVYSSREETVGLVYSSREGTEAWFTTVVRERPLGLQQSIDFQLSMVVIVLYLIRTGSNLYLWGGLFLSLKHKVAVCDHKTIACYRSRTAITSLNQQRYARHKKVVIWPKKFRGRQWGYNACPISFMALSPFR
jgi:hypothetical protein